MTLGVKLQGDKYGITIIFEIDGYEENLLIYVYICLQGRPRLLFNSYTSVFIKTVDLYSDFVA